MIIMRRIIILLFLICSQLCAQPGFAMEVTIFDVGEGQSVLLSQRGRGILIDAGHFDPNRKLVSKIKSKIKDLDYFLITHPHPDHAGGYFQIREAFPEAKIFHNCQSISGSILMISRAVTEALAADSKSQCIGAGKTIKWSGADLNLLWPVKPLSHDINENSLVIHLEFEGHNILLMGDANQKIEKKLMKNNKTLPRNVDILVAGHHGAADTGNVSFLKWVRPQLTVVSVDKGNIFGYPSGETIQRLMTYSKEVVMTKLKGDVSRLLFSGKPGKQKVEK